MRIRNRVVLLTVSMVVLAGVLSAGAALWHTRNLSNSYDEALKMELELKALAYGQTTAVFLETLDADAPEVAQVIVENILSGNVAGFEDATAANGSDSAQLSNELLSFEFWLPDPLAPNGYRLVNSEDLTDDELPLTSEESRMGLLARTKVTGTTAAVIDEQAQLLHVSLPFPLDDGSLAVAVATLSAKDEFAFFASQRQAAFRNGVLLSVGIVGFVSLVGGGLSMFVSRDLTNRRRAEEAQRKTNEELKRTNAELRQEIAAREDTEAQLLHSAKLAGIGQLAAGVAHEINNPLGAIVGYAQLISEDGALSPASKAQLERIIERAHGAAKVVGELKEFAGPAEFEKVSTDIHDVIERALSLVERQMSLDNIAVVRNYGPGLPAIECDPDRIEQVLLNLILNARDAMADGGTLTISTEVFSDGQDVAVTMSDTGKGISKDHQARIFEPFYTAGKDGGSGLGLSISQRIVDDHGGRIDIESEPGRGSQFTVWLPVSVSEQVSQRAAA